MQSNNGSGRLADAMAGFERAILEPIVEGEVAIRVAGMYDALVDLDELLAERGAAVPPESAVQAASTAVAADLGSEQTRLDTQLHELRLAARALRERAARVEPDEKRVQGEVDVFVLQARQFLTSLRQLEQARQHARTAGASHD